MAQALPGHGTAGERSKNDGLDMNKSEISPDKETLALAAALRRGRETPVSQRKANIEGICKGLGIVRSDLKPDAPKPSVKLFFGREN
jgi:hypothetical protein